MKKPAKKKKLSKAQRSAIAKKAAKKAIATKRKRYGKNLRRG